MRILLAPTAELAQQVVAIAGGYINCIETEYGSVTVRGNLVNLVHHGENSGNDAPCITKVAQNSYDCLVSHLDLDTLGGILAIRGDKPESPEFWKAAAYIDVHGPQYLHTFEPDQIDQLNAYWAWASKNPRIRYTEVTDITDLVIDAYLVIDDILGGWDILHDPNKTKWYGIHEDIHWSYLEEGRTWAAEQLAATQACLVSENAKVRYFETEQTFCNGAYLSPVLGVVPCIVSFNKVKGNITLSFYDDNGGDAVAIMQKFYGPEAGGRRGIAGTPRNSVYTSDDAQYLVEQICKGVIL